MSTTFNKSRNLLVVASSVAAICVGTSTAKAANTYSTGFETSEGFTVGQTLEGQDGWSGGDWTGNFNKRKAGEGIVNTQAYSGTNSWYFPGGPTTEGAGTPYSPNLDNAVDTDGEKFLASFAFKAFAANDTSMMKINTGNPAGNDRAEILSYVYNQESSGLRITGWGYDSVTDVFSETTLFDNVDASIWHTLNYELTRSGGGAADILKVSLDGGTPITFQASLNAWRLDSGDPYAAHSRLKFQGGRDGNGVTSSAGGFYIDDVSTAAVPEPATFALAGLSLVGMLGMSRRRIAQ